jgi:MATE family multidrug resistance protein
MLGAAIATNITYMLNMFLIEVILRYHQDFRYTRCKLMNLTCIFSNWMDYLKIGVPGACMICFEWWAFELLAIFSGYISVEALAAEVVIINIVSFIFMMPLGISYSASSLTGNYIGQGNARLAKRYANLTVLLTMILTLFVLFLMSFYHLEIASLFT